MDAVEQANGGIDVAGDGDVDEEQGAAAALGHYFLHRFAAEEVVGGGGSGDGGVGGGQGRIELVEGGGGRAEFAGKAFRAVVGAVGDYQVGGAGGGQGAAGQLAGVASADNQDLALG